jgi:hypothetical protein
MLAWMLRRVQILAPLRQLETQNGVEAKEASCRHRKRSLLLTQQPSSYWLPISWFIILRDILELSMAISLLGAVTNLRLDIQRQFSRVRMHSEGQDWWTLVSILIRKFFNSKPCLSS